MSSGAFRANAPELDVPAMERDLSRIPAVSSARVVVDDGVLHEVHIVCGTGRSPKLIGRDVQSLLAARWGVDIDHRKVSIVQLEGQEAEGAEAEEPADGAAAPKTPAKAPASRPVSSEAPTIARVIVAASGEEAEASVIVVADGEEITGTARGVPSWVGQRRIAAAAALDALAAIDPRLATWSITELNVIGAGAEAVVVCSVTAWRDGAERTLAGAAPVGGGGELRAAAESVLRAVSQG